MTISGMRLKSEINARLCQNPAHEGPSEWHNAIFGEEMLHAWALGIQGRSRSRL